MPTSPRYFADRHVVAWPDGEDVVLKRARSLAALRCSWRVAELLLNADGEDAPALCARLSRLDVPDPAGVLRAASEAGILMHERQAREADAFFESWAWSPEAATLLFGYHTDAFVAADAEYRTPPLHADAAVELLPAAGDGPLVALPGGEPDALRALVARRRSRRSFGRAELELASVAACLGDAFGLTGEVEREDGRRLPLTAAPSPGGLNTFDALLLAQRVAGLDRGTYCYLPQRHALARRPGETVPFDRLFGGQSWCTGAAGAVVLIAVLGRQALRYDFPTAISAALIEAGARVELLLLRAEAAGLAATVVGMTGVGAFDADLAARAGLPCADGMTFPLAAVLIGASLFSSK